eukprot:jgi/Botrbrau1/2235/Bobra.101_2s0063.1
MTATQPARPRGVGLEEDDHFGYLETREDERTERGFQVPGTDARFVPPPRVAADTPQAPAQFSTSHLRYGPRRGAHHRRLSSGEICDTYQTPEWRGERARSPAELSPLGLARRGRRDVDSEDGMEVRRLPRARSQYRYIDPTVENGHGRNVVRYPNYYKPRSNGRKFEYIDEDADRARTGDALQKYKYIDPGAVSPRYKRPHPRSEARLLYGTFKTVSTSYEEYFDPSYLIPGHPTARITRYESQTVHHAGEELFPEDRDARRRNTLEKRRNEPDDAVPHDISPQVPRENVIREAPWETRQERGGRPLGARVQPRRGADAVPHLALPDKELADQVPHEEEEEEERVHLYRQHRPIPDLDAEQVETQPHAARDFSPLPTAYPGKEVGAPKAPPLNPETTPRRAAAAVVHGPTTWTPSPTQPPSRPPVEDSPYILRRVADFQPRLHGEEDLGPIEEPELLQEVELYQRGGEPWRDTSREWETVAERGTISQPASIASEISHPTEERLGTRDAITSDLRHLDTDDVAETVQKERQSTRLPSAGAAIPVVHQPVPEGVGTHRRKPYKYIDETAEYQENWAPTKAARSPHPGGETHKGVRSDAPLMPIQQPQVQREGNRAEHAVGAGGAEGGDKPKTRQLIRTMLLPLPFVPVGRQTVSGKEEGQGLFGRRHHKKAVEAPQAQPVPIPTPERGRVQVQGRTQERVPQEASEVIVAPAGATGTSTPGPPVEKAPPPPVPASEHVPPAPLGGVTYEAQGTPRGDSRVVEREEPARQGTSVGDALGRAETQAVYIPAFQAGHKVEYEEEPEKAMLPSSSMKEEQVPEQPTRVPEGAAQAVRVLIIPQPFTEREVGYEGPSEAARHVAGKPDQTPLETERVVPASQLGYPSADYCRVQYQAEIPGYPVGDYSRVEYQTDPALAAGAPIGYPLTDDSRVQNQADYPGYPVGDSLVEYQTESGAAAALHGTDKEISSRLKGDTPREQLGVGPPLPEREGIGEAPTRESVEALRREQKLQGEKEKEETAVGRHPESSPATEDFPAGPQETQGTQTASQGEGVPTGSPSGMGTEETTSASADVASAGATIPKVENEAPIVEAEKPTRAAEPGEAADGGPKVVPDKGQAGAHFVFPVFSVLGANVPIEHVPVSYEGKPREGSSTQRISGETLPSPPSLPKQGEAVASKQGGPALTETGKSLGVSREEEVKHLPEVQYYLPRKEAEPKGEAGVHEGGGAWSDYDHLVEKALPREEVERALPMNPEVSAFGERAVHHETFADLPPAGVRGRPRTREPPAPEREKYRTVPGVFYESGGAQRSSLDVPGTPDRADSLLDTTDSVDAHFPGFKTPEQAAIFSTPRVDPISEAMERQDVEQKDQQDPAPSPPESPFSEATLPSVPQTPIRVRPGDRAISPIGPPSPLKRDVVVAEPVSPARGTERPLVPGTLERAQHQLMGLARKSNENIRALAEGASERLDRMSPSRARSRSLSPIPPVHVPEAGGSDEPLPPITRRASAFEGGKPVFPGKVGVAEVPSPLLPSLF